MAGGSAPRAHSCRSGVRIVVAGDHGTGKSTLIFAVSGSSNIFPQDLPDVLPPIMLPEDTYPDRVPLTIIDTSSRSEDRNKLSDELRGADAVILTYACDKTETFDRLSSFWIPELHRLEVKAPVVVVGCKLDLRDENGQTSLEDMLTPVMQQFREIEICIECSAHNDNEWAFMALTDTAVCLENLIYIGYDGDPTSAIHVTRKRRTDKKKQQSERNVYQCFVFGPRKSGKSTLLNSFIGRAFCESYGPTIDTRFAVNVIDKLEGSKKTLVLEEIKVDEVEVLLSDKESLSSCDVALFLYDSSDEGSWNTAAEMLNRVAAHGERSGYGVPSLIVAAKDDMDRDPTAMSKSTRLSQDMGIEAPIPVSTKLGETNNLFQRIVTAAEHPHLSIPETEAGRSFKHHHDLINRSLMITSVGAAMGIVGLAAYRVYITRKKNSS